MASGAELLRKVKEQIEEVDPREVHELITSGGSRPQTPAANGRSPSNGNGAVIVDVREQHEFEIL